MTLNDKSQMKIRTIALFLLMIVTMVGSGETFCRVVSGAYGLENMYLNRMFSIENGVLKKCGIVNKSAQTTEQSIANDKFHLQISEGMHAVGSKVVLTAGDFDLRAHPKTVIVHAENDSIEVLAAREIRRYVYVRTGQFLSVSTKVQTDANMILIGTREDKLIQPFLTDQELKTQVSSLQPQQYCLHTKHRKNYKDMLIVGGDKLGMLYGAYHFAELLGVRFYMHGDVVPDEPIEFDLPDVQITGRPLFELRGIQPFHDFPEGPDWWNEDDYKAILAQLPKLRMNFFGLHTYPQGGVGPEPTVWIGQKKDCNPDGTVKFSYPSRHFTTYNETGAWGYKKTATKDYAWGAGQIYERDDFGPNYMIGMNPWTQQSVEQSNELFNRMGRFLDDIFTFAGSLGIKTCIGTETPLTVPTALQERLKAANRNPADLAVVQELYEGIFQRIMQTHPLDYYWFWTPEGWTWEGVDQRQVDATITDFRAAMEAATKVNAPFTLATCGWVLGPPSDRVLFDNFLPKEMPLSCINRNVGFAFVEPGFAKIKDRPQWAIPWMEDDPALISPQLWAGRMRRDAADALAYGCTGLMGIHWRTRILGPNISALAHAAWEQAGWNPEFEKKQPDEKTSLMEGYVGGSPAHFPNNSIADTEEDSIYQTVRYNVKGYRVKIPNGIYTVTLKFCEPHYTESGKRVFGVKLQNKGVIDRLDIFAEVGKDRALDYKFKDIKVNDGFLKIDFIYQIEFPSIAGIVVADDFLTRKINCAGPVWNGYEADLSSADTRDDRPRDLPVNDFYKDWANSQFGKEAADEIARIFIQLDGGYRPDQRPERKGILPRPSTWVAGPGGIHPDPRPWPVAEQDYAFVGELTRLRIRIRGVGNLERFDYWLNNFRYLRATAKVACSWYQYNSAIKIINDQSDSQEKIRQTYQLALPARKQLIADIAEANRWLLYTVSTPGAMGNITNWQQHIMDLLLVKPGKELEDILGEPLPEDVIPGKSYIGPVRMFVPTVRTVITEGESLRIKAILQGDRPTEATIRFRPLGEDTFHVLPLEKISRGVYHVTVPAEATKVDFEYNIKFVTEHRRALVFPATAPRLNQTVVVMPK